MFCMSESFREPLVAVKRQILLQDTTVERHGEPCPGKTVISYKSGRFYLQFGWNRGELTHLIPFGMEVLFYFCSTEIPKSVNQTVT